MTCVLDINNLQPEDHSELIYYATHNILIYNHRNLIRLAEVSGRILAETQVPIDSFKYDFINYDDAILFLFNGINIVLFDKNGILPQKHRLDYMRIGHCITRIYPGSDTNKIIFGTKKSNKIQFVHYDFMQQQRIAQSASWEASRITDIVVTENALLFAVLDESTIICCDMFTGETLWTRFETAKINRGIKYHNGELFYSCQGLLKKIISGDIEVLRIPLTTINSIEYHDHTHIYLTSNKNKNLCCYHTPTKKLKWELFGRYPIRESISTYNTKKQTLLLTSTNEYIGVVNLSTAESQLSIRSKNIYRLRKTENHILIQKNTRNTTLIPGIKDVH